MPAQSQQQQKLFGLALSVKRGDTPRSEASEDVLGIVDSMSEKEIEDFASTKHKGLPKMKEQLRKIVREIMQEKAISEITEKEIKGKHAGNYVKRAPAGRTIEINGVIYTSLGKGKWKGPNGKKLNWIEISAMASALGNKKVVYKEGKKRFRQQDGIGKAKYTISYHDGKQKHKDGSDFFGIQIFKNKKDLETFRNALLKKGYIEESINEVNYSDQTGAKNISLIDSELRALFNPKELRWAKSDSVRLYKGIGMNFFFTDGKVSMGVNMNRPRSVVKKLGKVDNKLKQAYLNSTSNESVNESAGCGCGCGCGGSKVNEAIGNPTISKPFKSNDRTFDKVYNAFDKRDYFNSQGLAKTQIGNFERALKKNDKGAQQVLDLFKGDEKKAKDYITQVVSDRNKERAFNNYKALKSAVDSIQKGKPNVGAVDYVKRIIHNSSQKYSIALYSALRNQKFTKWKDIHDDVDSLIGESVNEARFDRNKLMRIMKKYDDAMIYTSDGDEFLIYSPYSNNKDNADMWHKNSVFALDKDATEHEIDYKDIVKIKG